MSGDSAGGGETKPACGREEELPASCPIKIKHDCPDWLAIVSREEDHHQFGPNVEQFRIQRIWDAGCRRSDACLQSLSSVFILLEATREAAVGRCVPQALYDQGTYAQR